MSEVQYALSIKQPWAEYILLGVKTREYRSWNTGVRGTVYIHASKIPDKAEINKLRSECQEFQTGGIVGKMDIVDVEEYGVNDFGFVLENVDRVDFVPCKGRLSFWPCNEVLKNAR